MTTAISVENTFLRRYPVAAAEQLEQLPDRELPVALASLEPAALTVAMEYLSPLKALAVFTVLTESIQREVLERAAPRLAVAILAQLPPQEVRTLLDTLGKTSREDLERLMSFPDDSAGRLMDRNFVTVPATSTVGEALEKLRHSSLRRARTLFVVAPDRRLSGRVDIQDLALAAAEESIETYVYPVNEVVSTAANREELVDLLEHSRSDSLPVVDASGHLMGVVRYRNLFHAIEDVATADLQKMVGVSPEERALSQPGFAIKRRLPWLHINLLTAFLAASVVGLFEGLIAQFTALAVLLPVVAGQSGNAGAQALAVTMRGLALREIGIRQWRSVLGKELLVGLANGLVLAITCGLAVFVWSGSMGLALVIAVAMVISMLVAGFSGALVPMILTRLGQDPATASSIILTTITDVAGFFSFLGTAMALSFML